jgi:predicted RNA-binding Zn ribbon-like protein
MTVFEAYFEEGLALALELANLSSAFRRGTPAQHDAPVAAATTRITDPDALHDLAARVRAIVTSPGPAEAAGLINGVLAEHRAACELALTAGRWRLHLHPADSSGAARDAVKAASGLAVLIDGDGWTTLRVCAASRCDDIFRDQSRNSTRRYCSRTCANRMNAEHARARRLS